jgi:hypothetical protein
MLPFLNKAKLQTGVLVKNRQPDANNEEPTESNDIEECAKSLLSAIESKDIKQIAEEIRKIYLFLHNEIDKPEDEQTKSEPHSYSASKEE